MLRPILKELGDLKADRNGRKSKKQKSPNEGMTKKGVKKRKIKGEENSKGGSRYTMEDSFPRLPESKANKGREVFFQPEGK